MATVNISVEEFKTVQGVSRIEIVRNPNTAMLFASCGGKKYKCQQASSKSGKELDLEKPITFIYDDVKGIEDGVFANSGADNTVGTL